MLALWERSVRDSTTNESIDSLICPNPLGEFCCRPSDLFTASSLSPEKKPLIKRRCARKPTINPLTYACNRGVRHQRPSKLNPITGQRTQLSQQLPVCV